MTEDFLHYLWKFQLLGNDLHTDSGLSVRVIRPGFHNTDAGPDFQDARIIIGGTLWAGAVEVHVMASDWRKHQHHEDVSYQGVILHLVYEKDEDISRTDGEYIETLVAKGKFEEWRFGSYESLLRANTWVSCSSLFNTLENIHVRNFISRLAIERYERKLTEFEEMVKMTRGDWEQLAYQCFGRGFGIPVNAQPFSVLCMNLPFRLVRKYIDDIRPLNALLFGQAGFLNIDLSDSYPSELKKIYSYLKYKHELREIPDLNWKFLRMRPVSFPTLRLAQFAGFLHKNPDLTALLEEGGSLIQLKEKFDIRIDKFWDEHHHFNHASRRKEKKIGQPVMDAIIINSFVLLQIAYARFRGKPGYKQQALDLLETIPPEDNQLIRKWKEVGFEASNALESQGLTELKTQYCDKKRCLDCSIGCRILGKSAQ